MLILAHRGASGYAPENTFAAFDLACEMGVAVIETDVQLTRDAVPVLFHDERVDRTTDGSGPLAELDWDEVARLDAGAWFGAAFAGQRVPRLEAFLDRYAGRVGLCIEIKAASATQATIDCVRRRSLDQLDSIEFSSFEWEAVIALREAFPQRRVGYLVRQKDVDVAVVRQVAAAGLAAFCPSVRALTPELVAEARAHGLIVRTWGVKTREQFQHVIACGADGTTLDCPDWTAAPAPV